MKDRNTQLGVRVRPDIAEAVKANADSTGIPIAQTIEDALLFYWGHDDMMLKGRRELATEAWKHTKGKTKRPFDSACGPLESQSRC